ncbi:FMN-binding negative transcriptional regulator [Hylemonella sp. W303a]|uniref:FMN-binding negative transcriptional regulator n=1 Tax=Hylemonella sp. W303a TaxID=3389873 RepID=UPI00396AFF83
MYLPPQFRSEDRSLALALMREHPFASLISTDDEGLPYVTHLPLHVVDDDQAEGAGLCLLGHVAKPNPHWRYLQTRPRALVTFLGPHAYMSPQVYPDEQRVPTWNYVAVHCTVEARLIEDADAKDALLKQLIGDHEPAYAARWRGLDPEFQRKMLNGIVAFELRVTTLQCKLKLNQHRPEAHAAMRAGYSTGSSEEQGLAAWMDRLGLHGRA